MFSLAGYARRALASAVARRLFLDRQVEFWLGEIHRGWSLTQLFARVVEVIEETPDMRTYVLRPGWGWRGHLAGQHTTVEVEIDGVRVRRCYTISSAPGGAHLSITVKRASSGRVSGWMHDHLRVGDVLRLGPAAGQFVLPERVPPRLLFLSGGSGITPVMSMLRDLAGRAAIGDVVFVHHTREPEVAFGDELLALAREHGGLRLLLCQGSFDEAALEREVPDFASRETFLCGPEGLMARAGAMWSRAGATDRLHRERFSLAPASPVGEGDKADQVARVRLVQSARELTLSGSASLLTELERSGTHPPSGCRMGICGTCKCKKRSGTVENLLTGAISSEPDEDIQLCISAPRSDLELEL